MAVNDSGNMDAVSVVSKLATHPPCRWQNFLCTMNVVSLIFTW